MHLYTQSAINPLKNSFPGSNQRKRDHVLDTHTTRSLKNVCLVKYTLVVVVLLLLKKKKKYSSQTFDRHRC